MAKKYITVQDYVNHFGMVVLSGYEELKNRFIKEVPMNRPGFELTGFFDAAGTDRLIIIGNKEMALKYNLSVKVFHNISEFN